MQHLLEYIGTRTEGLSSNPFITWLSDTSIPPRERLSAWLPCAAFFVFGFKDLNADGLRYQEDEALVDPLKAAINQHGEEDSMHWPWYLSDLRTLDLDRTMKLSEALKFLWSDETIAQRQAVYRLHALMYQAQEPLLRYSAIAALESYAHLLFAAVTKVSAQLEQESGIRLKYLGPVHLDKEPGHMANQEDETEDLLLKQTLDEATRAKAIEIAGLVCDVIDQRWIEFHKFAMRAEEGQTVGAGR
ncbi:MAG TPA: hypothetical protein VGL53_16275 [Bryobacteraceae bacterium]|jgi:hypothetical protein